VDLEEMLEQGKKLIFTIKQVKQEKGVMVAGTKGDFNIAYFKEPIKPLVLNSKNAEIVRNLGEFPTDIEKWNKEVMVELYIDPLRKLKGEVVGGIAIRKESPKPQIKDQLTPTHKSWNAAKEGLQKGSVTLEQIKAKFELNKKDEEELCSSK
jgi:hypothetical protein